MTESANELTRLKRLIDEARRHSMQLSYGRRAPGAVARPLFEEARRGLFARLQENRNDVETLRLLAHVEEALLNYPAALSYLKRAVVLTGQPSKKDLKKLAQYEGLAKEWQTLGLAPTELEALGSYLKEKLRAESENATLKWTLEWLAAHCADRSESIRAALRERGATSDMQVLHNVVRP